MDKEMIRAYLWQDIIRLGFCPSSRKDQKSWLLQYGKSLKEFWEVDSYTGTPSEDSGKLVASVNCDSLVFRIEYVIDSRTKFNVHFLYCPPSKTELMWIHDVDGDFFTFPNQVFLTNHGQRNTAVKEFLVDDIEAVVDGLLLHPAAHLHIESPIDDHEIRVGGGIDNPFQYLFQLRYQLCPYRIKREAERNRIIILFTEAIRNNSPISANQLMSQPEV